MSIASIRKSLTRGANQATKQAKKLVLSMLAVLLVASGISVSSVSSAAYAVEYTSQSSTTQGINFVQVAGDADTVDEEGLVSEILADSTKVIYSREASFTSAAVVDATAGTITEGNITVTYNTSYFSVARDSGARVGDLELALRELTSNSSGSVSYSGDAENPLIKIEIKNAAYTSAGESVDLEVKVTSLYAEGFGAPETYYTRILSFTYGDNLLADGFWFCSHRSSVAQEVTLSYYYSDSGKLVDDADFVFKMAALNVSSPGSDFSGTYAEGLAFISGFTNTVYYGEAINIGTQMYNRTSYARAFPSGTGQGRSETLYQGVMTKISGGTVTFVWYGAGAGTLLATSAAQDFYGSALAVQNTVTGSYSDTTKRSTFEVTLSHANIQSEGGTYAITYYNSSGTATGTGSIVFGTNGTVSDILDSNGDSIDSTSITLDANETFIISGLSSGTTYTVKETSAHDETNYTYTVDGTATSDSSIDTSTLYQASGSIASGELVLLTFDAARNSGNLTISKTVSDTTHANTDDETFEFSVELYDTLLTQNLKGDFSISYYSSSSSSEPAATGTVTLTAGKITSVTAGSTGTITNVVASDGTISLGDDENVTIAGLPSGVSYTVSETANGNYTTSWSVNDGGATSASTATGTISTTASNVAFTNTIQTFTLTILKEGTADGGTTKTPLAGAQFSVAAVDSDGDTLGTIDLGTNNTTDSDGKLDISGLEATVVYKLTEYPATSGYTLRNDVYIMVAYDSTEQKLVGYYWEFDENDTISFATDAATGKLTDLSADGNNNFQVSILNTQIASLPSTGGSGTLLISVTGFTLVAVAAYGLIHQKLRSRRRPLHARAA